LGWSPVCRKAGDARRVLHHVPQLVVQRHLHKDVAGQKHTVDGVLLAVAQLSGRLGRNLDAPYAVFQVVGGDAALQALLHLALKP
jgi:hypothetical protein